MVTYSEYRAKNGKEAADKFAKERGFSDTQIANESNKYEENELILNPSGGLKDVVQKQKKEQSFLEKAKSLRNDWIDWWLDFSAGGASGLKNSATVKLAYNKLGADYTPAPPPPNNTAGSIGGTLGVVVPDLWLYKLGGVLGSPLGPIGSTVSAFGLHAAVNEDLSQKLSIKHEANTYKAREEFIYMMNNGLAGNINKLAQMYALDYRPSEEELNKRAEEIRNTPVDEKKVGVAALKSGTLGAVVGGVGVLANKGAEKIIGSKAFNNNVSKLPHEKQALIEGTTKSTIGYGSEVAAFGTASPLIEEQRVPTAQDFIDSAIMIGTLKATHSYKTVGDYKKAHLLRETSKLLKDAAKKHRAQKSATGFTTVDENMALYEEADKVLRKAEKQNEGLTQRDLEEGLQFLYIQSSEGPRELSKRVVNDPKAFQQFVLVSQEIKDLGGLSNAMRDPMFKDKYFPQEEFTPLETEVKETPIESKETVKLSSGETELFVGARNNKLEESKKNAENLVNEGKLSREEIRQQTGWDVIDVKTQTGEQKRFFIFEIDDSKATIKPTKDKVKEGSVFTMEELIDHPLLFELYPWIKDTKVKFYTGEKGDYGYFSPRDLSFGFNTVHFDELKKTALHELQHVIQAFEEWGRGGGVIDISAGLPDHIKPYYEERTALVPYLRKPLEEKGFDVIKVDVPVVLDLWRYEMMRIAQEKLQQGDPTYAEKYNRFVELLQFTDPYEAKTSFGRYLRLWGENQARNTSRRSEMTAEERRAIPPSMTQDFPDGMTTVRIGGKIYPIGAYTPNAMNKSLLYSRADKMNIYIGEKEKGTYEVADTLGSICDQLIRDIYEDDRLSVFKEKMSSGKNVRGTYHRNPDFIRLRESYNISVLSHELAHRLEDKKLGGMGTFFPKQLDGELKLIATKGKRNIEGFAEMLSYYIIDPEYVKKVTPNAYKFFEEKMSREFPDTFKLLQKYQEKIRLYQEQPSMDRVISSMRDVIEDKNTVYTDYERLYTAFVDDQYPVKVIEDEVYRRMSPEDRKWFDITNQSPYEQMRRLKGISGKIKTFIDGEPVDFKGAKILGEDGKPIKSLKKITKGLSSQELKEFDAYLKAKHVLEIYKLDRSKQLDVDPNDAVDIVKNYGEKYEARAKEVYKLMDVMLRYAADAELISEKSYEHLRKVYPSYVPNVRAEKGNGVGTSGVLPNNPIKKLYGSDKPTLRTVAAIQDYFTKVIINAEKNSIMIKMANLAEKDGAGAFMRPIKQTGHTHKLKKGQMIIAPSEKPNPFTDIEVKNPLTGELDIYKNLGDSVYVFDGPQKNEFVVRRGDETQTYVADPELMMSLKNGFRLGGWNNDIYKVVSWVASAPTKIKKTGATIKPSFIISNWSRDQMTAAINAKYGYIPGIDSFIGGINIILGTENVKKWEANGGSLSAFFSKASEKEYASVIKEYYDKKWYERVWNVVNPANIEKLGEFIENSSRVGAYMRTEKNLLKKGFTPENAAKKAAFESRDITLDFSRAGYIVRELNKYSAFLNANVQGVDKAVRTIKDQPKRSAVALSSIVALFMANELLNKDNDEVQGLENYLHYTNLLVPVDGVIYKIPISQEVAPLKAMVRMMFQTEGFANFGDEFREAALEKLDPTNYILSDWQFSKEYIANYDYFRDKPIIPAGVEKLLGPYQFSILTTETAKKAANTLVDMGVPKTSKMASPMMLEYMANSITGGASTQAAKAIDKVMYGERFDPFKEDKGLLKSMFTVFPGTHNNKYVKQYNDIIKDLSRYINTENYELRRDIEVDPKDEPKIDFYYEVSDRIKEISEDNKLRMMYLSNEMGVSEDEAKDEILLLEKNIIKNARFIVNLYNKQF